MKPLNQDKQAGQKDGTIVFIHDNSSSMRIFDPVFNSDKVSHSLIRLDLPGHGDSYRSESTDAYSVASYQASLLETIDQIDENILLVGNALGGHLCLEIAQKVQNLKGILIFGSPPVKNPLNLDEAFSTYPMMGYRFLEEVAEPMAFEMFSKICFNQEVVPEVMEDFFRADPKVRSAWWNDLAAKNLSDEAEILTSLNVPRYVMHGDMDLASNLDYLRSLNVSDNPFEIIELNNCGAYPTLDQPEVFIKHLNRIAEEIFG